MTQTIREVMTPDADTIGEHESAAVAARYFDRLDVGALPIRGDNDRLQGIVTDRDIVRKVVAQGLDPAMVEVGTLGEGVPVTVDAGAPLERAAELMAEHRVRRLPVLDNKLLVGMVSQADLAAHAAPERVGETVEAISRGAPV